MKDGEPIEGDQQGRAQLPKKQLEPMGLGEGGGTGNHGRGNDIPVVAKRHLGGHLIVETLEALGVDVVFGIPGAHVLALWDGLRTSRIQTISLRTELSNGFAADGYARVSGRPGVLAVSTGPGALNTLTAQMEAASAHVPLLTIASQIPRALIGRGRGYLHALRDQRACFEPVVKWTATVQSAESLPEILSEAWGRAKAPPSGPVFVEVPVDILEERTTVQAEVAIAGDELLSPRLPPQRLLERAVKVLESAQRPVIWAGGGVLRSGAWSELAQVAELVRAPVATTYMGKGAFPAEHPLSAGSSCNDAPLRELLRDADVVLCVGTELGAETTGQYSLSFAGQVIHIDAAPERIGASYQALGLVGDAKAILVELAGRLSPNPPDGRAEAAVEEVRERIESGLASQGLELEVGILETIRNVLPPRAVQAWDMTIMGYWAAEYLPVSSPRRFLYALGSGTLGYAWPAALGASVALGDSPTLAVVGDGGAQYGLQELAAARQYSLRATLLLINDGCYGILREYQEETYGQSYGMDLWQPDFRSLSGSFAVPARRSTPERLHEDLAWAIKTEGPAVVVLDVSPKPALSTK